MSTIDEIGRKADVMEFVKRNEPGWTIIKWANDGSSTAESEINLVDEYEVHVIARAAARGTLKSAMAAALADPDVDGGAKSLAGYLLGWLEKE